MSSATASGAIIGGTFAFIAFSLISAVGIFFMRRMSKFTKDEVRAAGGDRTATDLAAPAFAALWCAALLARMAAGTNRLHQQRCGLVLHVVDVAVHVAAPVAPRHP